MIPVLLALNSILMVIMPIAVAIVIRRKTGAGWPLFFIGAATFILSQVFHIPFNWIIGRTGWLPADVTPWLNLIIVAVFYGLSAGVFEEGARYLTYRFWAKDARSWSRGMMLGAGHGGIEAIVLGLLLLVNNFTLLIMASSASIMRTVPADQQSLILSAAEQVLQTPWYQIPIGTLERAFAIIAHLALSVMVLQVFLRGSHRWLFLAIGYHALLDAAAVLASQRWGIYVTEGIIGLIALLGLFIIFRLRTPEPVEPEPEPLPPPGLDSSSLQPTDEMIDRSRYS